MKVYIAGPLCTENERKYLEEIDRICKKYNIKTFLPHRDCGLWKTFEDTKKIAKGDLDGFLDCNLLIANLNGFNVGAGTAWEMGYAHANKIKVIGLKTDRKIEESIEELSAIIIGTTEILSSLTELEKRINEIIKKN